MSVYTLTNADQTKLFNEFVMPGLHVEIKERAKLYGRFKSNSSKVAGKHTLFKCLTGATPGRPMGSSTFPTPKQGVYNDFLVYMKRGYGDTMQFDGLTQAVSKGKGAVVDIVETEVKGKAIAGANKLNKQFWGDGSGRLAQVVGAVSNSTSVIVDGPLFGQDANFRTNPANYLFQKQLVDIYTTAGVLEEEDVEISSILDNEDGTATLTMSTAVTCSNNAYIFDTDTYSIADGAGVGVPMGLSGILGTSDIYNGITAGHFQNVDRAAAAGWWARTQSLSASSNPVSDAYILRLLMECEKNGGRTKALITNEPIYRAWYQIMKTDNTLTNEKALWQGTTGMTFYGGHAGAIPIIYDSDCPDNKIVAMDEDVLEVHAPTTHGMQWIPGDSGILTKVHGKDEWSAELMWYYNFVCTNPQALGQLTSVKHAAV
jgi:hypothetical protein